MKLLVGTLYSGENQFQECCTAIRAQNYQNYEHIIIENLTKKEAHDKLYTTFMSRSNEFDLLIKVDADMVIKKNDLFHNIVSEFKTDPILDLLLVAVHDYFTDRLVIGMNIFRNTVRWIINDDHLFTDMKHIDNTIRKVKKDYTELAPAADHCNNPGPFQAFHFGFHRGMKAIRGGTNWNILFDVIEHHKKNADIRLAYAIIGANAAFKKKYSVKNISYNDITLKEYFNKVIRHIPEKEINLMVNNSKLVHLYNLPIKRSLLFRYYYYKSKAFS
jgi:hypothetical protein